MRELDAATFDRDVLRAERPVVVDFWAPWCGPCKAVHRLLEELETEHADRIDFVRLNVDEHPGPASRYGVLTLPTTIVFAGGEPRETVLGARPRADFERVLAPWVAPA